MKKVRLTLKDIPHNSKDKREIAQFLDKFDKFVAHTDYHKENRRYPDKIVTVTFTPIITPSGERFWQLHDSALKKDTYAQNDLGMLESLIIYSENYTHGEKGDYIWISSNVDGYLKEGVTLRGYKNTPKRKTTRKNGIASLKNAYKKML